jgi:multidrug efflux pump subunit AcrB
MRVWLRPDRLAKLGLTPSDVIRARSGSRTRRRRRGRMGAEPAKAGQELHLYREGAGTFLREPEEFGDILVRSNRGWFGRCG